MSQIILCITVDFFSLIIKIWGRNLGDGILSVYCIILSTFLFSKNFENFYFEVFLFLLFFSKIKRQKWGDRPMVRISPYHLTVWGENTISNLGDSHCIWLMLFFFLSLKLFKNHFNPNEKHLFILHLVFQLIITISVIFLL